MRGDDQQQSGMFSYVSLEDRVPQDHPLRPIRKTVDEILRSMAKEFDGMYAKTGRPSVPPERLLRAVLLQIFYTVRSERMLMEQMKYNLLFRWFVGLEMDEPVWNHAVFSKNRERLLNQEVAGEFFVRAGLGQALPIRRTLQRGQHVDRRLGEPEELSEKGRQGWGSRSVSRRATQQRDA